MQNDNTSAQNGYKETQTATETLNYKTMQISTETHKMRFHKDDKEMQNTQRDRKMQNDSREMKTSSETQSDHKTQQQRHREQLHRA